MTMGPNDYRYLASGLDTVDLALYIDWGVALHEWHPQLEHLRERAIGGEPAVWRDTPAGECVVSASGKRNYRWCLQFPGFVLWLSNSIKCEDFANGYVSPRAESLWIHGLDATVESITGLLGDLGGRVQRVQVSRVDLAADFAIPEGLTTEFLKATRVGRSAQTNQYETAGRLETFYAGQRGAPLQGRIYDKALQVSRKSAGAFMYDIWGGPEPAWRVEFQVRRAKLRSFGVESVDDLRNLARSIWDYLTCEWMSLRLPDASHTSRRTVHPWWTAVQQCADEFGPTMALSRVKGPDVPAPVEWYVSHLSGCLAPLAARLGLTTIDETITALQEKAQDYWADRRWADALTKKYIELGRIGPEGADDVPI